MGRGPLPSARRRRGAARATVRAVTVLGAAVLMTTCGALVSGASGAGVAGGTWHFEETSGQVAVDSSGLGSDGVIRGPVGLGQPGHTGRAFAFGATTAWVEVPSSDRVNPGSRDFTASAWVKFTKAPSSGVTYDVIRKGLSHTAGGEFKLEIVPGGRVRCIAKDAARVRGAIAGPARNLADGSWHHVACQRSGRAWRAIADGIVRSKTVGLGAISNAKSLAIGGQYGKEDPFPGLVDEVDLSIG